MSCSLQKLKNRAKIRGYRLNLKRFVSLCMTANTLRLDILSTQRSSSSKFVSTVVTMNQEGNNNYTKSL